MGGINVSTFNAVKEVARQAPEITRADKVEQPRAAFGAVSEE